MTSTKPGTGGISLNLEHSEDKLLIGLAHEFTNRSNLTKLNQLSFDVRMGNITPQQYADGVADIEKEAVINQNIVAKELVIVNPFSPITSAAFNNGEISEEEMKSKVEEKFDNNNILSGNDHTPLKEKYKKVGEELRNAALKHQNAIEEWAKNQGKSDEEAKRFAIETTESYYRKKTIDAKKVN